MREPGLTIFILVYWFIGGYAAAWFTPYALEVAISATILGLLLLIANWTYEDRQGDIHFILGCLLFAPPLTMMVVGASWLFLEIAGLV